MKSLIIKSIALSLITVGLWSCKKDETKIIATSGTAGSLKSSVSTIVLDKTMLTTKVLALDFSASSFGSQVAYTSTLQVGVKGANFTPSKDIALDANSTTKSFNGLDLNNLLLSLNLPFTTGTDVEFRIKSALSSSTTPIYSNVVTVNAKPFPLTAWVYVPGAYQNWLPTTADSLISATGNGVYIGVIPFTAGNLEFKITPAKNWNIAYGSAGAGLLSTTSGDNLKVPIAGAQEITADLNTNSWVSKPLVWSIIGDAIPGSNWNVDTDMKFINDGKGVWTVTANLTAGGLKFRKNHDWGISIGDGANNVTIAAAGKYTLTLTVNPDGSTGTFTLVKN